VGGGITAISFAVSVFNPVLWAGVASAGLVLKSVGALGDAGKALIARGDFNTQAIKRTIDGIRADAGTVRAAYNEVRGRAIP
jgi:hypothetical protein